MKRLINNQINLISICTLMFSNIAFNQAGNFGTVVAHNTRTTANSATYTLTLTAPNTCANVGNLRTGTAQVRNFMAATLDHLDGSSSGAAGAEQNLVTAHGTTNYVNMWFRVTIAAGSGISGFYIATTQGGTAPTTNTGINNIYANVWTGTSTTLTQARTCNGTLGATNSLERFDNMIAFPVSSAPHIRVNATERINVTAGTSYMVEIWAPTFVAMTNTNINFDVQIIPLGPVPANSSCASATLLNLNSPIPTNCTLGARRHCTDWEPSCYGSMENTVFYTFTKPASGNFTVQLSNINCEHASQSIQTGIARITPGSCSALTVTTISAPSPNPWLSSTANCSASPTITYNSTNTPAFATDPPGTQYILMIDGNNGSTCSWGITVLPVEWSYFEAERFGEQVYLGWETATENNSYYFEVERSNNAEDWISLDRIGAAGTSSIKNQYRYYDEKPTNGYNYYRIKQVDLDGSFTYSDIRAVEFNGNDDYSIVPNPNTGAFVISKLEKNMLIEIYAPTGQLVYSSICENPSEMIELNSTQKGVYFLKLNGEFKGKFVIQ